MILMSENLNILTCCFALCLFKTCKYDQADWLMPQYFKICIWDVSYSNLGCDTGFRRWEVFVIIRSPSRIPSSATTRTHPFTQFSLRYSLPSNHLTMFIIYIINYLKLQAVIHKLEKLNNTSWISLFHRAF